MHVSPLTCELWKIFFQEIGLKLGRIFLESPKIWTYLLRIFYCCAAPGRAAFSGYIRARITLEQIFRRSLKGRAAISLILRAFLCTLPKWIYNSARHKEPRRIFISDLRYVHRLNVKDATCGPKFRKFDCLT